MQSVAVCGSEVRASHPFNDSIETIDLDGIAVCSGVMPTATPDFDPASDANAHRVLVEVSAFSCNYRDKAGLHQLSLARLGTKYAPFGSEFVGTVRAVGRGVESVSVGDRVIADNHYPNVAPQGYARGLASVRASRDWLVLREEKVIAIPSSMPDAHAAAFSLGAQTAYAMTAKLGLRPGDHVLVTAARSNTSLFAISALHAAGVHVTATTTSLAGADRVRALGASELFRIDPHAPSLTTHDELRATAESFGGFDGVFDPFLDLHLTRVLPLLKFGGRYVTCGWFDQSLSLTGQPFPAARGDYLAALQLAMMRNLTIIGSCCGTRPDLRRALDDYAAGRLSVVVDSVFAGGAPAAFLARTYTDRARFGKVVYAYPTRSAAHGESVT